MPKRDYYEVLGVSKDADEKAIKSAYRKLAMANHPDRNAGDEAAAERFKEASEAYEVLKDSQKRAAYDQMGHAAFEQGAALAVAALAGRFWWRRLFRYFRADVLGIFRGARACRTSPAWRGFTL